MVEEVLSVRSQDDDEMEVRSLQPPSRVGVASPSCPKNNSIATEDDAAIESEQDVELRSWMLDDCHKVGPSSEVSSLSALSPQQMSDNAAADLTSVMSWEDTELVDSPQTSPARPSPRTSPQRTTINKVITPIASPKRDSPNRSKYQAPAFKSLGSHAEDDDNVNNNDDKNANNNNASNNANTTVERPSRVPKSPIVRSTDSSSPRGRVLLTQPRKLSQDSVSDQPAASEASGSYESETEEEVPIFVHFGNQDHRRDDLVKKFRGDDGEEKEKESSGMRGRVVASPASYHYSSATEMVTNVTPERLARRKDRSRSSSKSKRSSSTGKRRSKSRSVDAKKRSKLKIDEKRVMALMQKVQAMRDAAVEEDSSSVYSSGSETLSASDTDEDNGLVTAFLNMIDPFDDMSESSGSIESPKRVKKQKSINKYGGARDNNKDKDKRRTVFDSYTTEELVQFLATKDAQREKPVGHPKRVPSVRKRIQPVAQGSPMARSEEDQPVDEPTIDTQDATEETSDKGIAAEPTEGPQPLLDVSFFRDLWREGRASLARCHFGSSSTVQGDAADIVEDDTGAQDLQHSTTMSIKDYVRAIDETNTAMSLAHAAKRTEAFQTFSGNEVGKKETEFFYDLDWNQLGRRGKLRDANTASDMSEVSEGFDLNPHFPRYHHAAPEDVDEEKGPEKGHEIGHDNYTDSLTSSQEEESPAVDHQELYTEDLLAKSESMEDRSFKHSKTARLQASALLKTFRSHFPDIYAGLLAKLDVEPASRTKSFFEAAKAAEEATATAEADTTETTENVSEETQENHVERVFNQEPEPASQALQIEAEVEMGLESLLAEPPLEPATKLKFMPPKEKKRKKKLSPKKLVKHLFKARKGKSTSPTATSESTPKATSKDIPKAVSRSPIRKDAQLEYKMAGDSKWQSFSESEPFRTRSLPVLRTPPSPSRKSMILSRMVSAGRRISRSRTDCLEEDPLLSNAAWDVNNPVLSFQTQSKSNDKSTASAGNTSSPTAVSCHDERLYPPSEEAFESFDVEKGLFSKVTSFFH